MFSVSPLSGYAADISGKITSNGSAVSNVFVDISQGSSGCYNESILSVATDTNGIYTVSVPDGNQYYVRTNVRFGGGYPDLVDEYWDGSSPANTGTSSCNQAVLTPPAPATNINFDLAQGGHLTGTISDINGPIDGSKYNMGVTAFTGSACDLHDYVMGSGLESNGTFSLNGLPLDGQYLLMSYSNDAPYIQEWFAGYDSNQQPISSESCEDAVTVSFPQGSQAISDIGFQLEMGAVIQGTVTDSAGNPISNACVNIFSSSGFCDSNQIYVGGSGTNQNGTYSAVVPPGSSYYVQVWPACDPNTSYLQEYWNGPAPAEGTFDCHQAQPTPVLQPGTPTTVDFSLEQGGRLTGIVSDSNGPLSGSQYSVGVNVFTGSACDSGSYVNFGNIGDDGSYSVLVPLDGQYVLTSYAYFAPFMNEWYAGLDSNNTPTSSANCIDAVTVSFGQGQTEIGNLNFQLEAGGTISGTISDIDGLIDGSKYNMGVSAYTGSACEGHDYVMGSGLDSNGTFSLNGLPLDGQYLLMSYSNDAPYIGEWFAGYDSNQQPISSENCEDAITVSFPQGSQDIGNIGFQLGTGAVIQGTVTDSAGNPISNACVFVFSSNGFCESNQMQVAGSGTNHNGTYSVVVPSGSDYYVQVWPGCDPNTTFIQKYWKGPAPAEGTLDCHQAQPTPVLQPGTPTTVDFSLEEGVKIIGQVKDENTGEPVDNIVVMATTQLCENENQISRGKSATVGEEKGYYQLLVPKNTPVYIQTCVGCESSNDYMDIWYPKVSSEIGCENATGVSVPSGSTELTGIDLLLPTDTDHDGVSDADETNIYGTDPTKSDSDGDGLNDGGEVYLWGSDFDGDIDGDLILNIHETDADNDGVSDRQEFARGSHPDDFKNPNSTPPPLTLYEDFSSPTLDPEKWEVGQYGMEVKNNALQLFAHAPNSKKVYARLNTTVDENLKTTFKITDLVKNASDNQGLYYSNLGVYYSENPDPSLTTGRVASTIYFGNRGNGLEAWYWIGRTLNENEDTEDFKTGVLLPAGSPLLALNTQYSMEIRYDGNNGFTYAVLDAAGNILSQVSDTGPALVSSIDKHLLSAKVKTPDSGGKIAVVIDKVETSTGANPYAIYDTFDGASLDSTKWNEPEIVKEVTPEGKLRMLAHSFGDKRTTAATMTKRFNYIETRVVFDQDSIVSAPSTIGRARLAMDLYNDTYGPDPDSNPVVGLPHNGYEGNVWGQIYIDYIEGRGLVAKAYAERAEDPNYDTYKELFWEELDIELQFGVEYILSIGFSNDIMVFAIDSADGSQHAMAGDSITTPKYLPFNPGAQLATRAYGNGAETRQMAYFDDVRVSGEPLEIAGDVNVDGAVNLQDAILTLQAMAGINDIPVWSTGDVNGDHLIGLPEIIEIIKSL